MQGGKEGEREAGGRAAGGGRGGDQWETMIRKQGSDGGLDTCARSPVRSAVPKDSFSQFASLTI